MRTVAYHNPFSGRGHYCHDVLIRCMDFRFHRSLEGALRELLAYQGGFDAFDSPGVRGGGSKCILDADSRKVVFAALNLAIQKHKASRVVVADHVDCRAYGGSPAHENAEAEERFHAERLHEACAILRQAYPGLDVVAVYQDWDSIAEVGLGVAPSLRRPL